MKVSFVISCYNEKGTIEKIVEAVGNAPLADREIIMEDTLVCLLVPTPRNFSRTPSGISARNFSLISAAMGFTTSEIATPTGSPRKAVHAFYYRRPKMTNHELVTNTRERYSYAGAFASDVFHAVGKAFRRNDCQDPYETTSLLH